MKQLVFFASGSGTNFQSVIDAVETGRIEARIAGLITNNPDAGAIQRARNHDIPVRVLAPASFEGRGAYESELLQTLERWQPDLIVLAGYLLKIPRPVLRAYPQRIINIHPSLLPKFGGKGFYGKRVHQAVLEAGEDTSGCSVHIVDEEYDRGPVLAHRTVPVKASDTADSLAQRVLKQEHELLPEVIQNYLSNLKS